MENLEDETPDEMFQRENVLRVKNGSGGEEVHYSVFHEGLPSEYKLFAEKTLGETFANREEGLRRLRKFMKNEQISVTDVILLLVLRSCKYNFKKSESKLISFLKIRRIFLEKLCAVDDKKIELILRDNVIKVLPYRDKYGRAIVFTKPTMRFDQYSMEDIDCVTMCLIFYLLTFPMTTVCGIDYIAECKCNSFLLFYPVIKSIKSTYIRHMFHMPIRYGRAHLINENMFLRMFVSSLRFLVPKKLSERVFLHGNSYESLHAFYHRFILTKDLEGNLESNDEIFIVRFLKFIRKLREEAKCSNIGNMTSEFTSGVKDT